MTTAIILAMLFFNILNRSSQINFIRNGTLFLASAMLVFTMSAPDALSVQLNLNRATEEKPIDIFPLFHQLSAEAYPKMKYVIENDDIKILDLIKPTPELDEYCGLLNNRRSNVQADKQTRNQIANWENKWNNKFFRYERGGGKGGTHVLERKWQSWNISRAALPHRYNHENVERDADYSVVSKYCQTQFINH